MVTLPVDIFSKGIDLNPRTEEHIQRKFRRLERHLDSPDSKLEVSRTSARARTARIVAQMTLLTGGRTLRAQESASSLFEAVDSVFEVMYRQIQRYKGKHYRSGKARRMARTSTARERGPAPAGGGLEEPEDPLLDELGAVVRTKRFPIKPMTVGEAIMEMELLSHGFFFFHNVDTGGYAVVYRRHDGDHGLIEPETT